MTIEEIRDIPIAVFLARMGYEPARRRGDEYWYLAPYREERTASFQLNVRMDNGSDTCNLFEGFIDCLSWMQLELGCGDDYLVLNSVALLERSFPVLDRYERVNCYLDRDEAGRRTLEALRKRYADKIVDCSSLYKGYKDLNEYLQNKFL